MILPAHPNIPSPGMRAIGYWTSEVGYRVPGFGLPDPHDFVDPAWDQGERRAVIAYLCSGRQFASWRGWSRCRFCGVHNGSRCLEDGTYVWPEGFAHYLEVHAVRPPHEFVRHALNAPDVPEPVPAVSLLEMLTRMMK